MLGLELMAAFVHLLQLHAVAEASLPYEPVCTENLTPWLKLLPCGLEPGTDRRRSGRADHAKHSCWLSRCG